MRPLRTAILALAALLYGAAALGANTAAGALTHDELSQIAAMRVGEMRKLGLHDAPKRRMEIGFVDQNGFPFTYADFAGKVVLVNFWATWCAPCRKEMPSIDRLQARLGGEDFVVVAISTDRGNAERPLRFLKEIGAGNLKLYQDRRRKLAANSAILGLPATLILDREGREVARMLGGAEWDSPEAVALIERIIAATRG